MIKQLPMPRPQFLPLVYYKIVGHQIKILKHSLTLRCYLIFQIMDVVSHLVNYNHIHQTFVNQVCYKLGLLSHLILEKLMQ